jgi:integrase
VLPTGDSSCVYDGWPFASRAPKTHLAGFFAGDYRVRDITTDRVTAYVAARREDGAANATINRELAALKLMLRLGERAGKVVSRPYIALLEENNVKKGFFEEDQFDAVRGRLSDDLRPVFDVAYITGWRVKSEILTRQKTHLDLRAGWLRLEPGETKNRKRRMFPLVPRLRAVLEAQAERTRQLEQKAGSIIPWLFHRHGHPVKSFRRAWLTACRDAGVPMRTPHDFRQTAIRNLERSGVPRSAAMAMVGHQTEAVYDGAGTSPRPVAALARASREACAAGSGVRMVQVRGKSRGQPRSAVTARPPGSTLQHGRKSGGQGRD